MNAIENAIKTIVEAQGLLYLRTVNINDLNAQAVNNELNQGVGIYANLPSIEYETFEASNNVIANVDIEVYYMKLNPEIDDKGTKIDEILNELLPYVNEFYDLISRDAIISPSSFVDGYQVDATDTLKLSVEVLTGWRVQMTLPVDRKLFYC